MTFISPSSLLTTHPEPPNWLVPHFIVKGSLVAIGGDPGVGKSYLGYLLALSLASGHDFLGQPLSPTGVLYFDQENSLPDLRQYLFQLWGGMQPASLELLSANLHIGHFALGYPGWLTTLRTACAEYQPQCVIFDTANTVFNVQKEEDNAEATRILNNLRIVMSSISPETVFVVFRHAKLHVNYNAEEGPRRTMRGAKVWHSMVDQVVFLVKGTGRPSESTHRGFTPTTLLPDKTRAFGLKAPLHLRPQWVNAAAPLEQRVTIFEYEWEAD